MLSTAGIFTALALAAYWASKAVRIPWLGKWIPYVDVVWAFILSAAAFGFALVASTILATTSFEGFIAQIGNASWLHPIFVGLAILVPLMLFVVFLPEEACALKLGTFVLPAAVLAVPLLQFSTFGWLSHGSASLLTYASGLATRFFGSAV
jgi:hypothetical protein